MTKGHKQTELVISWISDEGSLDECSSFHKRNIMVTGGVGPTINLFPRSLSLTVSCPIMDHNSHANEIKLIFKVWEVKRLVGVKVHQDGFKLAG